MVGVDMTNPHGEQIKGDAGPVIGVVGLGVMGREMASRLAHGGSVVHGFDQNPGVWEEATLRHIHREEHLPSMARTAQILWLSLPGPTEVGAVLEAAASEAQPGTVIADTSTIDPESAQQLGERAGAASLVYAHLPVIGGQVGARAGTLTVIVGAPEEARLLLEPLLPLVAATVHWVGNPRHAATLKLLNNLVSLGNTLVFAEAMAVGAKAGLKATDVYDVLHTGSAQSQAMDRRWTVNIQPGHYDPGFMIDLALKDLRLATTYARDLGLPLFHGALTEQVYRLLQADGLGGRDVAAVVPWWAGRAHVRIGGEGS